MLIDLKTVRAAESAQPTMRLGAVPEGVITDFVMGSSGVARVDDGGGEGQARGAAPRQLVGASGHQLVA